MNSSNVQNVLGKRPHPSCPKDLRDTKTVVIPFPKSIRPILKKGKNLNVTLANCTNPSSVLPAKKDLGDDILRKRSKCDAPEKSGETSILSFYDKEEVTKELFPEQDPFVGCTIGSCTINGEKKPRFVIIGVHDIRDDAPPDYRYKVDSF